MTKLDALYETGAEQLHITSVGLMGAVTVGQGCILEVASDTVAMQEALTHWAERLMREEGANWESPYFRAISAAKSAAFARLVKAAKP